MFCPQCGNELPDVAKFCAKCGHQIQRSTKFCASCGNEMPDAATFCPQCGRQPEGGTDPSPAQGSAAAPGQDPVLNPPSDQALPKKEASFTPVGIAARIVAVLAVVAMFMPWLEVPSMQYLAGVASSVNINVHDDFAYTMPEMGAVAKVLDQVASYGSSYSSNLNKYNKNNKNNKTTTTSSSKNTTFSTVTNIFLVLWVIAIAATVFGLIGSLVNNKSPGLLIPGGILIALVAIAWFASISYLNEGLSRSLAQLIGSRYDIFEIPLAVGFSAIAGIATCVLGAVGKATK